MNDSPFGGGAGHPAGLNLAPPPTRMPPPPQQAAPPQPQPPAVSGAITGHVMGKFSDSPLCTVHFPGRAELARLAYEARSGRPAAFVGQGHEYTPLMCACLKAGDHPWRLGDHVARLAHQCLSGGNHDRCADRSCECDCGGHEERAAALQASDGQLAAALREISATMGGGPSAEVLELLREVQASNAALTAKVAELEAAKPEPVRPAPRKASGSTG